MTEIEIGKAIAYYEQGLSAAAICKKIGYTPHTVLNALVRHGVKIRSKGGYRPSWNEDYFRHIDTEAKAYFLGFLTADGNVGNRVNSKPKIAIQLQSKDKYILELFKSELGTPNIIEYNVDRGHSSLRVHSQIMADDLRMYGIVPNKTGKEIFAVNTIEEPFMNHYIRGFFDGDGWFSTSVCRGKNKFAVGFSKNVNMLTDLRDYLCDKIPSLTKVKIHDYHCNRNKGYIGYGMLMFSKRQDVIDIAKYMYRDASIYLQRKYETYQTILKIPRGRIGRPRNA